MLFYRKTPPRPRLRKVHQVRIAPTRSDYLAISWCAPDTPLYLPPVPHAVTAVAGRRSMAVILSTST